jgi:hypothetical protein
MRYLGIYQPCSDTWVWMGKSSRCPIRSRRLMTSAVVRLSGTKKLRDRSHADRPPFVRDAHARLIFSRDPAAAITPTHDRSYLQVDQPDRHDH